MRLNTLSPDEGSRPDRKRVGRGIGCGFGKTCGRGHKGQKSRAGGKAPIGFEGGQMPLQRRLPKVGFSSRKASTTAEVRLGELAKVSGDTVDLAALKAANVVPHEMQRARIILSGKVGKPYTVRGLAVTKGARAAIESAGGKIEE